MFTTALIVSLLSVPSGDSESGYATGGYEDNYRRQMMTARREAEQQRRILARTRLSAPTYTEEQRASSWIHMAQRFDKLGKITDAALCNKVLIRLYPATEAASLAQEWLWEHGY